MKKLLSLGVLLLIGMTAVTLSGSQERVGNEGLRERFVGGWRLVSLEALGPDRKIHNEAVHLSDPERACLSE